MTLFPALHSTSTAMNNAPPYPPNAILSRRDFRSDLMRDATPCHEPAAPKLDDTEIQLTLLDDERMMLEVVCRGRHTPLRQTRSTELLAELVGRAARDIRLGAPESRRGWTDTDQLCRFLGVDRPYLSALVYRIRKKFRAMGYPDCHRVIEVRRGPFRESKRPTEIRVNVAKVQLMAS